MAAASTKVAPSAPDGTRVRHKRIALLLVVPFLLSGCSLLDALTGGAPAATPGSVVATPGPGGTPWLSVTQGAATPSPSNSYGSRSPTPTFGGFLALPSGNRAGATPAATCLPVTFDFSRINALTVKPGTTTATASWYNLGGYNLVQFRMTAMSQDVVRGKQRDIGWVTITPKSKCGAITATITGLNRKTRYVMSVDAVVNRRSGDGTHAATVFRSGPFRTS
jgi:hypothetical protein